MPPFKDISGETFGRLVVLYRLPKQPRKHTQWMCRCRRDEKIQTSLGHLKSGHTKSCGCLRNEDKITHGLSQNGDPRYLMWCHAKRRARAKKLPFTIQPRDIQIPKICPLLGTSLHKGRRVMTSDSPTLDRIVNRRGYTPDNIWVISSRANAVKSDLSLSELKHLLVKLEEKIRAVK